MINLLPDLLSHSTLQKDINAVVTQRYMYRDPICAKGVGKKGVRKNLEKLGERKKIHLLKRIYKKTLKTKIKDIYLSTVDHQTN